MTTGSNIEDMGKAIEKNERYKVLSKHEYDAILALASKRDVAKGDQTKTDVKHTGNTPEKVNPNLKPIPNPIPTPPNPNLPFLSQVCLPFLG